MNTRRVISFTSLFITAVVIRFFVSDYLKSHNPVVQFTAIILVLIIGAFYLLRKSARIIEETTEVLSHRTSLAGGLLQSIGTAFPDMILGVLAAVISLRLRSTDLSLAVNYAIIAAATTFGSNIYNITHAAWCMGRQLIANRTNTRVRMFPGVSSGGTVYPFSEHSTVPHVEELNTAMKILTSLTLLTAFVAISMVLFGRDTITSFSYSEDLYQLIRPIGIVVFVLSIGILYSFRKTHRTGKSPIKSIALEETYYEKQSTGVIFAHLVFAGIIILFSAETMVHAIQTLSEITHIPSVLAGALAGIIGCLGEMLVIHNYSVNHEGRIGDALIGVGMDNIVTTTGAAIVAMMGGIFLGGSSLIVIFVLILAANTVLLTQISLLKNSTQT